MIALTTMCCVSRRMSTERTEIDSIEIKGRGQFGTKIEALVKQIVWLSTHYVSHLLSFCVHSTSRRISFATQKIAKTVKTHKMSQ